MYQTARSLDQLEPEDPVVTFAYLILRYHWDQQELCKCGVVHTDFHRYVACLREQLLACNLIEEADSW